MKIALSTDHAGFEALQHLESFLVAAGHECVNFGPKELDAGDDYPDFIKPAAVAVSVGECQVGIIFGGSGEGEAIAANRVKGVRCGVFYGPAHALKSIDSKGTKERDGFEILRLNRQHNDANMLSLAGRFLDETTIQTAVTIWLQTPFSGDKRHIRRIGKLDN